MPRLSSDETAALVRGVDASMARADRLFGDLATQTADEEGVTRASYGDGEQTAHRLFADTAARIGLEVSTDLAGNSSQSGFNWYPHGLAARVSRVRSRRAGKIRHTPSCRQLSREPETAAAPGDIQYIRR